MILSPPGKAALAGSALVLQAINALPAAAIEPAATAEQIEWAEPLEGFVLREVTALRIGGPGLATAPSLPATDAYYGFLAETSGSASSIVQTSGIELPRPSAGAWTTLGDIVPPRPHEFAGTSQNATNIAMAITLNGTTTFAYVRQ